MFGTLLFLTRKVEIPSRLVLELLLVSFLVNVLGLVSSLYSMQVMNRYVTFGVDATLVTLTTGALLALALEFVLREARTKVEQLVCNRAVQRVQNQVLVSYASARYQLLEQVPVVQRREALSGLMPITNAVSPSNMSAVLDAPFALLYVLAVALLSPLLAGTMLVLIMGLWFLSVALQKRMREPTEELTATATRVGGVSHFLVSAAETLRMFNCAAVIRRDWSEAQAEQTGVRSKLQDLQGLQQQFSIIGANLMTILIYAVGSVQVVLGHLDLGSLIGASILSARALSSITRLTQSTEIMERARHAYTQLDAFAKIPTERQQGSVPKNLKGQVQLVDVSFAWPGQPLPLFESLSLSLPAGSVLAVVGGNASGKSSLIRLFAGLLEPERGHVKFDGFDVRQFVPEWWRNQLVYLPQEPTFFDGALRDNLSVLAPQQEDAKLLELCHKLDLTGFLDGLPRGLDTPVRNGGQHFPVGVRRRLAMVRALLTGGRIVILDEPMESVDARGSQAMTAMLNELVARGCTLIIATRDEFIIKSASAVLDLSVKPVPKVTVRAAPSTNEAAS
jgi:ATP-binding cassette subfamily C protein LapB